MIPSPSIIRALTFCLVLAFLSVAPCGSSPAQTQTPIDLSGKNVLVLHSYRRHCTCFPEDRRGTLEDASVRRDIQPEPVFRVPGPEAQPRPRAQETSGRADARAVRPSQARNDRHRVPGSPAIRAAGLPGCPSRCPHHCPGPAGRLRGARKRTASSSGIRPSGYPGDP